jgi:small subunit ribosomal protein S1
MADEKKPESQGPVVIRKGHVKPPPPGTPIEAPQEERLAPAAAPAPEREDRRPLWQRVAEEQARPAGGGGAPRGQGGGPRPGGHGPHP